MCLLLLLHCHTRTQAEHAAGRHLHYQLHIAVATEPAPIGSVGPAAGVSVAPGVVTPPL